MSATEAKVSTLPKCQVPGCTQVAYADAAILHRGRRVWGFCCLQCFTDGDGHLGTGRGQVLVVAP